MRFLPTRAHGVTDHMAGLLLITAPRLFGFATGGPEEWLPLVVGVMVLGLTLVTDYEVGAVRRLPMPAHLALDGLGGALLAASPWLFGFSGEVWLPHLLLGLSAVLLGLVTKTRPEDAVAVARRTA